MTLFWNKGIGVDDLWRYLPASAVLWFCLNLLRDMGCTCLPYVKWDWILRLCPIRKQTRKEAGNTPLGLPVEMDVYFWKSKSMHCVFAWWTFKSCEFFRRISFVSTKRDDVVTVVFITYCKRSSLLLLWLSQYVFSAEDSIACPILFQSTSIKYTLIWGEEALTSLTAFCMNQDGRWQPSFLLSSHKL